MTDIQCAGCGYYRPRHPWATPECQHELHKRLTERQREAIETGELKCTWHTSREVDGNADAGEIARG